MKRNIFAVLIVAGLAMAFMACGDGPAPPAPNGEACELAEDCQGGACILDLGGEIEFPDGLCSAECDIFTGDGCDEEVEICLSYRPTGQSNCYPSCEVDDECREGYTCFDLGHGDSACLPPL